MNTRWILAVACLALAVPAARAQPLAPDGTLAKIKERGEIVLGVRDASIPFSFLDDRQEAVGYSVDLCMRVVEAVKQRIGAPALQVKKQVVTSATRIPLIANGTIDLECGSTVNNLERQKLVAFSTTTFLVNTKFIARKPSNVRTVADLKGKTVIVTAGTNTAEKVNDLDKRLKLELTVLRGADHAQSFTSVETGRAAAFAEDDILLAGLAANSKAPGDYNLVAIEGMDADPYALMFRRGDPEFRDVVDGAIAQAFRSGEIEKLYDKWFMKPIPPRGIVLNFPPSEQWKKIVAHPTDSGDPKDYR